MQRALATVYSHSSLLQLRDLPQEVPATATSLKRPVETEGIEAFVGKRVHEVLERLNQFAARGLVPSLARVIARFRSNWEEQYDAERLRIVRAEMTRPGLPRGGRALPRERLPAPLPLRRREPRHRAARPFPLDGDGRYAFRGVIDRLVRARDGALEIHDYKTGRRVPSQQDLDSDRQLALYQIGARAALRDEGSVRLVWHYLFPNLMRTSQRTPEQLAALREETRGVIDRIRAETAWEPREGPLCRWCEYQSVCPVFAGAAAAKVAELPAPDVEPDEGELGQLSLW